MLALATKIWRTAQPRHIFPTFPSDLLDRKPLVITLYAKGPGAPLLSRPGAIGGAPAVKPVLVMDADVGHEHTLPGPYATGRFH